MKLCKKIKIKILFEDFMIIAISGKSGTGKSFISEQLATFFNAEVISFDKISHQTLEDDNIKNQITNRKNKNLQKKRKNKYHFART